jgi:hypothetical protein
MLGTPNATGWRPGHTFLDTCWVTFASRYDKPSNQPGLYTSTDTENATERLLEGYSREFVFYSDAPPAGAPDLGPGSPPETRVSLRSTPVSGGEPGPRSGAHRCPFPLLTSCAGKQHGKKEARKEDTGYHPVTFEESKAPPPYDRMHKSNCRRCTKVVDAEEPPLRTHLLPPGLTGAHRLISCLVVSWKPITVPIR